MQKILKHLFICLIFTSLLHAEVHTLYVVDARNLSYNEKLLLVSLQGVVNNKHKTKAIFIALRGEDLLWLNDLKRRRNLKIINTDKSSLLIQFKDFIKGQIIYDENALYTANIATILAGIKDGIITSSPLDNYKVLFDCRNKWKDKITAYKWAIKNLMPSVNRNMCAILSDSIISLRDFLISNKVFVFDLDPINNETEINLIKKILSFYKPTTPVLGWPDAKYADPTKGQNNVSVEVAFVSLISPRSIFLVASDFACNLSVYQKFPIEMPLVQLRRKLKYDPSKVYLTFVYSDGDNIQYVLNHMRNILWDDPARSKLPIGWTIAPLLYRWGSFVLEKYYADALFSGNDEFVMGPSGFGYVHPSQYKDIEKFLRLTDEFAKKLDLTSVAIIDEGEKFKRINTYRKFGEMTSLNTIFNVGNIGIRSIIKNKEREDFFSRNYVMLVLSEDLRGNYIEQNVEKIKHLISQGRNMIYCYAHAWEIRPSQLLEIKNKLSDMNVEVVAPSTFSDLWFQKYTLEHKKSPPKIKRLIYNISAEWQKFSDLNLPVIKAVINPSAILYAQVVYWFDNKNERFFQYLYYTGNNIYKAVLPFYFKGNTIHYYIEILQKDFTIKKTKVYTLKVKNYFDNDGDGLIDEFEKKIIKTSPELKDTDDDGLYDKNDIFPLTPIENQKEIFSFGCMNESQYLWKEYKSRKAPDGHRYADNDAYFIYKIPLDNKITKQKIGLLIDNNFVVEVSSDGKKFTEIFRSPYDCHDGGNRGWRFWEIPEKFIKSKNLYIKISDGSKQDGWGGGFYSAKIFTKWGDLKIINIKTEISNNILKISSLIANKYKLKDYKIVLQQSGKKIYLNPVYEINRQSLFARYKLKDNGNYRIIVSAEDVKGNKDLKEKDIFYNPLKKEKYKKLIKEAYIINRRWITLAGWNEGDCDTPVEKFYLYKDFSSAIDINKHRFADAKAYFIYKFTSPSSAGLLKINAGNNFVFSISSDLKTWEEVLNSYKIYGRDIHDLSNYKEYVIDISNFLRKSKVFYIKVSDGSPADGWGGNVGKIELALPPCFKKGEKVEIEVIPVEKDIILYADCSALFRRRSIFYSKDNTLLFHKKKNPDAKYIIFYLPYNIKNGIYKIYIIAEKRGVKEKIPLYISIGSEPEKKTIPTLVTRQKKGLIEYLKEFGNVEKMSDILVDERYIMEKRLNKLIEGWGEGKCGTKAELNFLEVEGGAINPAGQRFADMNTFFVYKFKLPPRTKEAIAKILVGNNFVIEVYNPEARKWEKVLESFKIYHTDIHDMTNYKPYYLKLTKFLGKKKVLRIKFSDGSKNDGWGACVGNIEIYGK